MSSQSEIDAKLDKLDKAVNDPSLTNEEVKAVLREVYVFGLHWGGDSVATDFYATLFDLKCN